MQYRSIYRLFYSVPVEHAGERFVRGGGRELLGKISLENFPELGLALVNKPWEGGFSVQPMVCISRKYRQAELPTAPWKRRGLGELAARPARPPRSRSASAENVARLVFIES